MKCLLLERSLLKLYHFYFPEALIYYLLFTITEDQKCDQITYSCSYLKSFGRKSFFDICNFPNLTNVSLEERSVRSVCPTQFIGTLCILLNLNNIQNLNFSDQQIYNFTQLHAFEYLNTKKQNVNKILSFTKNHAFHVLTYC